MRSTAAVAVVWVVMCFAALAWSIPRSNSDQHINSFWLSPKEKGRETVSMVRPPTYSHTRCEGPNAASPNVDHHHR